MTVAGGAPCSRVTGRSAGITAADWACAEVETNPQKARARTVESARRQRARNQEQVLERQNRAESRDGCTVFRPVFRLFEERTVVPGRFPGR